MTAPADRAGDRAARLPVPAQPLEQGDLRRAGEEGQRDRPAPGACCSSRSPPAASRSRCAVVYARMRMQRRWRAWLTEHTMTRWLAKGRYYQLNVIEGDHKNPEARIAEDIRIATEQPVDFAVGILSAVLTSATFMGVLWMRRRQSRASSCGGTHVFIPGYLVHRGGALLRDHQRADDGDRAQLRADRRNEEPDRGRVSRGADARARIRRKHRDPRRREGRARRARQAARQGDHHLGEDGAASTCARCSCRTATSSSRR